MVISRGDVWWAELGEPGGSEPGYTRPVVIVSADAFNESALNTVTVVSLTTNLRMAKFPGNVLLGTDATGLPKDSVANITQIATIDKDMLRDRVRALPEPLIRRIDDGLRIVLDLRLP